MTTPGRGWALKITTTEGTVFGIASLQRGCFVGGRHYRPAAIRPMHISCAFATPDAGCTVFDTLDVEIENADWWAADHFSADRLDGAEVVLYAEIEGTFDSGDDVLYTGRVMKRGGVRSTDRGVRLSCVDERAYWLEEAVVSPRSLDKDEFPSVPEQWEDFQLYVMFGGFYRGVDGLAPLGVYADDSTATRYIRQDTHDYLDNPIDVPGGHPTIWAVDTKPPTDEHEPDDPHAHETAEAGFVDLYTSFTTGKYLEVHPDVLTNWSGDEGTFRVNKALWLAEYGEAFDATRWTLLAKVPHGAATDNADAVAALTNEQKTTDHPLGSAIKLYLEHTGFPGDRIDYAVIPILNDATPDVKRLVRSPERVDQLLAWLYEETGLVESMTRGGLLTWKLFTPGAVGTAVLHLTEAHVVSDVEVSSNAWGAYFNSADAQRDQGRSYDDERGRGKIKRRKNLEAIAANGGVEVPTSLEYHWLADKNAKKSWVDRKLALQGKPNDLVRVTVRADDDEQDAQVRCRPGDVVEFSYLPSDTDENVRTVIAAGSVFTVVAVDHDLDTWESTLTLWRWGSSAVARQSAMVMMDGTEQFPASLGGGDMFPWDDAWSEGKKAYASGATGRAGGYLSDAGGKVLDADASDYAYSLMQ